MSKILVTGATGTVGSVVAECLLYLKIHPRVLSRNPDKLIPHLQQKTEVFTGDYHDPDSMFQALTKVEKLFLVSPPHPEMDKTESKVIDMAKEAGVKYVILISAVGASDDSPVKLARLHARSEKHLTESGMDYTILRPHSFMQNLFGSASTIKSEQKLYSSMEEGEIPMVDARDIGEVAAMLLKKGPASEGILDITGPKSISYNEIAESFSRQLEKEINFIHVPGETAREAMINMGYPEWLADDLVKWAEIWKDGNQYPSDAVKQIIHRTPRSIGEFISDHLKAFQGSPA